MWSFLFLLLFPLSLHAQLFSTAPNVAPSPSYRVRWDAEVREPKGGTAESECGFQFMAAMIESADSFGVRVQAQNRSGRALDLRLRPGDKLREFLNAEAFQDFHGVMPPEQMFSLLWEFDASKEEILKELAFDFFIEAKTLEADGQVGDWQCRRRAEIVRIREKPVPSHDPFFIGLQIGTTAARTGDLADLGSRNTFAWGLDFGYYREDHWGFVLGLDFHDYGGGGAEILSRMRAKFPAMIEPHIRSYDAGFMLSRRWLTLRPWSFFYDAGLGLRVFQYGDQKADRLSESELHWGFQHRASAFYRVKRYRVHPFNKGVFDVGITLDHHVASSGEVLGLSTAGQSLAGLLQFRFSN